MQYYTERHRHTCGVDLHGRNLYLCVLDPYRKIALHRRVDCDEEKLLKALGILAAKLARSVYYMLHRNTPFDMGRFVRA